MLTKIKKALLGLFLIFLIAACNPQITQVPTAPNNVETQFPTSAAAATQIPRPTNTTVAPTEPPAQPTNSPIPPSPTTVPENRLIWSIQTGDLDYFAPLPDGTIYAIGSSGPNSILYAILSSDGGIVSTTNIQDASYNKCLRPGFKGGFTAPDIHQWFYAFPDGTMFSTDGGMDPCTIIPEDPPSIQVATRMSLFPFANSEFGSLIRPKPEIPSGFTKGGRVNFWVDKSRDDFQFYINKETTQIGLITRNATFLSWSMPSGLDFNRTYFTVTPWDDIYFRYEDKDALGNSLGDKLARTKPDGTYEEITKWPVLFDDFKQPIIFLPWEEKIFAIKFDSSTYKSLIIEEYDQSFIFQREIPLAPEIAYADRNSIFIGYDKALYVFTNQTLTKYQLP